MRFARLISVINTPLIIKSKLAHHFSEHDEFALSFAKKTRFATMKERYSRRFGRTEPNPFLSPETAYHYETSYMHTFGDWLRVDSALFYSEVKDAIEEVAISKNSINIKMWVKKPLKVLN